MLKKFITWFIVFGLSFWVSEVLGVAEQGKAFLFIHLSVDIILIISFIVVFLIAKIKFKISDVENMEAVIVILTAVVTIAIILLATWGATNLFGVDFFVAYQIMTFGQCLIIEDTKKETNN